MLQQDDLLTQKIEILLEMNAKKLLTEVAKLHQEIAEVKEELAALKRQRPAQPAPHTPASAPAQQEERRTEKPIDRNGVSPADVDIQKMFYFGNKKQ